MNQKRPKTQDRPAIAQKRLFPVFESIGQASATIGCSQALIKAAKRKGCHAFLPGSRVDSEILLPFLFQMLAEGSQIPDGFSSWKEVLESEKARREAIKRQIDERATMPTAEAERQAAEACSYLFSELERMERELPPSLAGGTAVDIFKRLHQFTEGLRKSAQDKFNAIGA